MPETSPPGWKPDDFNEASVDAGPGIEGLSLEQPAKTTTLASNRTGMAREETFMGTFTLLMRDRLDAIRGCVSEDVRDTHCGVA
jgi:hypothetical protein